MLTKKIDFSSYSKEDLIHALESVDDEKYPENAIEIYSLLESKLSSASGSIDAKYDEENGVLDYALELVFFPVLSGGDIKRSQMKNKLLRIRHLVDAKKHNKPFRPDTGDAGAS